MIFTRLFRKYFLNYDIQNIYILHRNLNIIKKINESRYKGKYNRLILSKNFLYNKKNICVFCQDKYLYDIIEFPYSMPIKLQNNLERLDKNLIKLICPSCHKLNDNDLESINYIDKNFY